MSNHGRLPRSVRTAISPPLLPLFVDEPLELLVHRLGRHGLSRQFLLAAADQEARAACAVERLVRRRLRAAKLQERRIEVDAVDWTIARLPRWDLAGPVEDVRDADAEFARTSSKASVSLEQSDQIHSNASTTNSTGSQLVLP